MDDILFRTVLSGFAVMPAVRMTRRSKYANQRHTDYINHINGLADWLRAEALVFGLKQTISVPACVEIVVCYTDGIKRDGDNIYKTVMDACVKAGIVEDDSLRHVPCFSFRGRLYQNDASLTIQIKEARYK